MITLIGVWLGGHYKAEGMGGFLMLTFILDILLFWTLRVVFAC